ncbi:hypothetical protein [Paenibacillus albiflavus]|nr:hypothetical protein [Paenibacillus albiflavus]
MKESTWVQKLMWCAIDEHGQIIRTSETPPDSWLDAYKSKEEVHEND